MNYQHDEFSVADLRQTLSGIWTVVSVRRAWFIFPTLITLTIACVVTHWLPRSFTVSTTFERRKDIVLANMGHGWAEALESVRNSTTDDLSDPKAWRQAASFLQMPQAIAGESFVDGLAVKITQPDTNRDVISMTLTARDAGLAAPLLKRVRDDYIAHTAAKTSSVLTEARGFYQEQTERCRHRLAEVEGPMVDLERCFPGVSPVGSQKIDGEITSAKDESRRLTAALAQLDDEVDAAERDMRQLTAPAANPIPRETPPVPNPQHAAIKAEIEKVEHEVWEAKTVRRMTDLHPTIVGLRNKISELSATLENTPAMIAQSAVPAASVIPPVNIDAEAQRLSRRLDDLHRKRTLSGEKLGGLQQQIETLTAQKATSAAHRDEFALLSTKADQIRTEMNGWRQQIDPLDRVLTVHQENRGFMLRPLSEPVAPLAPTSPNARTAMVLCVVISLVVGAGCVLAAEMADRSFRNPVQIAAALAVPVLGAIDEIVTRSGKRREFRRRALLIPAIAACVILTATSTGLAWLNLANPTLYRRIVHKPMNMVKRAAPIDQVALARADNVRKD